MTTPRYDDLLRQVRAPERIRSSDLIRRLVRGFHAIETPDPALVAGTGAIGDIPVLVFGQEKPKGRDAALATAVNFGMMRAAGYWFVVDQLEQASDEQRAVVTFIDTPGADPTYQGIEQLLAWAVSASMSSFIEYPGPSVSVIIGEGGSGGALALQVADRRLMVSDAIYSVISPESCSAILFRDHEHIAEAMRVLKPDAPNMLRIGVIDQIVGWPGQVSTEDHDRAAEFLRPAITEALAAARALSVEERVAGRSDRLVRCGVVIEGETALELSAAPLGEVPPPRPLRFIDADTDDDSIGALRQAYFFQQGLGDWTYAEAHMLCPAEAGGCNAVFTRAAYEAACWACPSCGRGDRLGAALWLRILCDPDSFEELCPALGLQDIDNDVYDSDAYRRQRLRTQQRTGADESMRIGRARIEGTPCVVAISDFDYMGGTLGAVAGEKLRLACELARRERLPLFSLVCSGGVRMQDGTLGLVQMARANAAVQRLMAAGLPHVVMMADPCTGGAMASYATCASTILAEPRALLSFAGPRVLQLAGLPVDERRLVSEAYARHGGIDEIVPRKLLRSRLRRHFEEIPPAMQTAARRRRALARRRVSAWFGEIINQLSGVIDGAHGLFEAQASEQANVVAELTELWHTGIPALLVQAATSANVRVRATAIAALSRTPDFDASVVERALGDSHHRVRAEAALGVLRRDPEHIAARRTVVELLTGSDATSRRHGLYVATAVPLAVFLPHVRRLAGDADSAVRLAAGVAAVAAGETDVGLDLIRAVMAERGSRDSARVERLIGMMPPGDARWLRERLELE